MLRRTSVSYKQELGGIPGKNILISLFLARRTAYAKPASYGHK